VSTRFRISVAISVYNEERVDAGDFALLSHRVIDELRRLPEHHRYLRGLRAWVGFRQIGILVERSERFSGKSMTSKS
jgi:polyisoprenyl-phosphate glycosyltransferase